MLKLYSYVLRFDDGAAPNPFWDVCTLTICKPGIRKTAQIGDWVIGTGSKKTQLDAETVVDLSDCVVYAMKVTDVKTLKDYDAYCNRYLPKKIPQWKTKDWRNRMGDCIYDFSQSGAPRMRRGVHDEGNRDTDLSGRNALLSTQFYYFGTAAIHLPPELLPIIKKGRGHKIIRQQDLVNKFVDWIAGYKKNKIYGDPQLKWRFQRASEEDVVKACSICHLHEDSYENPKRTC